MTSLCPSSADVPFSFFILKSLFYVVEKFPEFILSRHLITYLALVGAIFQVMPPPWWVFFLADVTSLACKTNVQLINAFLSDIYIECMNHKRKGSVFTEIL